MTTVARHFDDKYYPIKDVDPAKTGTHMQKRQPIGGWPNTCAPEQNPGRKIRAARKRLEARNKDFIGKNRESNHVHHLAGSLKCK